jgi:hypothetical protein
MVKFSDTFKEFEEDKKRRSELVVLFFKCREEKKVKACPECKNWSASSNHFENCPHGQDSIESRRLSDKYKNRMPLESLDLPDNITKQIFPPEKNVPSRQGGPGRGHIQPIKRLVPIIEEDMD